MRDCPVCRRPFRPRSKRQVACSTPCANAGRRTLSDRQCALCGSIFRPKETHQRFCSVGCAKVGKHRPRGAELPHWKGGRRIHNGYVRVYVHGHPRTRRGAGYVFEHILVMERVLGRHLLATEHVHHKNGRRDDNRPENLELWRIKDPPGVRASDYHCHGCACATGPASIAPSSTVATAADPPSGTVQPDARANLRERQKLPVGSLMSCPQCGDQFVSRSRDQRCCSRTCARRFERDHYRGGRGTNWKGGRFIHKSGYVWMFQPAHPRAMSNKYVPEHVLVMEKLLGRYLEAHERIHHRNGRRDDNRAENLELWRLKHDPKGVRAADYHCPGCSCATRGEPNGMVLGLDVEQDMHDLTVRDERVLPDRLC